jgi:uncharacterized protein YecT (DUF1311 family)
MRVSLIRCCCLFLVVLFLSSPRGMAQHMSAPDVACRSGSSAEITQCFIAEAQVADNDLTLVYGRIWDVLVPDDQARLQTAQRVWIQFRDANCAAERELYAGASAAATVFYACLAADTRQRTIDLNTMYGGRLQK